MKKLDTRKYNDFLSSISDLLVEVKDLFAVYTPALGPSLELTFDNITNADLLVGDSKDYADWNDFFGLPTNGTEFYAVTIDGNVVTLSGGGDITITEYLLQNNTNITKVNDLLGAVSSIENGAFHNCIYLTEAIFPACTELVQTAYDGAFEGCDRLVTVDFPLLTSIHICGFYDCLVLENINFPSVTFIGESAFSETPRLIDLSFPKVLHIGNYAFMYNPATSISFPLLQSTGDACFQSMDNLETVSLPSLVSLGEENFTGDNLITVISLPKATSIAINGFAEVEGITTVSLPLVRTIGNWSFYGCIALTSLSIPSCTALGSSVGNNSVFTGITTNTITLTVSSTLMTCNTGGTPDGDIAILNANNTLTIVQV